MEKMFEIRWHGRGGQGAVTAARILAEAAVTKGHYAQAFPEFGPERRGAPVQAFTRLNASVIRAYYGVANPDAVIVLDATLLDSVDVTQGLVSGGILLINTALSPAEFRGKLRLENAKLCTVNASIIAQDCIGVAIPNTAMIGALVKATDILSVEDVMDYIKRAFASRFSGKALEGNLMAIRRAYEEVKAE